MISLSEIIQSKMECMEPQNSILTILKRYEGKRFDKRVIDILNSELGRKDIVKIVEQWGGTKLRWQKDPNVWDYNSCRYLYMSGESKNVYIDIEYILGHNRAWFGALSERNQKRNEWLLSYDKLVNAGDIINGIISTRKVLEKMEKDFTDLNLIDSYEVRDLMEKSTERWGV